MILDKAIKKILFDFMLLKETNFKIAFLQFVRDFIIRDGMRFYGKVEYKKNEEIKRFLKTDLQPVIQEFKNYNIKKEPYSTLNIWVFWGQGFEKSPELVKICLKRLEQVSVQNDNYNIIKLDLTNYINYVKLPPNIVALYEAGKLSVVNFSDILRVALLNKYGGIWVDSTVFISSNMIDIGTSSIYTVKHKLYKENEHICKGMWSTFFLVASESNVLFSYLRNAFYAYCEKHDFFINYFLIDCLIAIGYEEIPTIKMEIDSISVNNTGVFDLLRTLENDNDFNFFELQEILSNNSIHKLAYQSKKVEIVIQNLKQLSDRLKNE